MIKFPIHQKHYYLSMLDKFIENLNISRFSSAQLCDSCSGLRFSNGYRTIITCETLFGVKLLPILFVSCTPECIQNFLSDKNHSNDIPSRDTYIINDQFIFKLKTR
jgi:hypothetical protein